MIEIIKPKSLLVQNSEFYRLLWDNLYDFTKCPIIQQLSKTGCFTYYDSNEKSKFPGK
jgi:hypothetical protein